MSEFKAWPKIPRFNMFNIRVTEKLDGTNACIFIGPEGDFHCQSRSKIITPDDDNYGFATWAYKNKEDLLTLGHGYHYGEWYGNGIQRRYSLPEKRFALFNTFRPADNLPANVDIVPILYDGLFSLDVLNQLDRDLRETGSRASPGFMDVEGMVIYFYTTKERIKWIINK